jgi:hypothetical protein
VTGSVGGQTVRGSVDARGEFTPYATSSGEQVLAPPPRTSAARPREPGMPLVHELTTVRAQIFREAGAILRSLDNCNAPLGGAAPRSRFALGPIGDFGQDSQSSIHGRRIGKSLGHVRLEEHDVGAFALTVGTSAYIVGKSGGFYTGYKVRAVKRIALAQVGSPDSIFEVPVIAAALGDASTIPSVGYATSTVTGRPRTVRALRGGAGSVRLEFGPAPDKAYRVYMLANMIPTLTYSGSSIADYWNDLTLVKGLYAMCLGHQQDEREEAKLGEYRAAVKQDIARHLSIFGTQAKWNLSRARFGSGGGLYGPRGNGNSTKWMGPR